MLNSASMLSPILPVILTRNRFSSQRCIFYNGYTPYNIVFKQRIQSRPMANSQRVVAILRMVGIVRVLHVAPPILTCLSEPIYLCAYTGSFACRYERFSGKSITIVAAGESCAQASYPPVSAIHAQSCRCTLRRFLGRPVHPRDFPGEIRTDTCKSSSAKVANYSVYHF